jgi:hypothetical protein
MQQKINIEQELNDLQLKVPIVSMPEFSVPAGYFDNLEMSVLDRIHSEDFIAQLPKNMPFDAPQGYFDQLSNELNTSISLEQLPKNTPYQVPIGYFNDLDTQILSKIAQTKPSLKPLKVSSRRFAPLSMAASILFFIVSGFFLINQQSSPSVEQQLAKISDDEINLYIQAHQQEFETDLVSAEALDDSQVDIPTLEKDIIENQLNTLTKEELSSYIL